MEHTDATFLGQEDQCGPVQPPRRSVRGVPRLRAAIPAFNRAKSLQGLRSVLLAESIECYLCVCLRFGLLALRDREEQMQRLRERSTELGEVGVAYLKGLESKQRNSKYQTLQILGFLHAYHKNDATVLVGIDEKPIAASLPNAFHASDTLPTATAAPSIERARSAATKPPTSPKSTPNAIWTWHMGES